jgi:hypothetical protein
MIVWDEGREPQAAQRVRQAGRPIDLIMTCAVLACVTADAVLSFIQGPFAQVWEFALTPFTLVLMLLAAVTILLRNSNRRSPWTRAILLAVVIGVPYVYVRSGAMRELQHVGLRRYVTSRADLGELQAAALELIDAHRSSDEMRRYGPTFAESDNMPSVIRRLEPYRVLVFPESEERRPHVLVGWGAAFTMPFGVLLGPPEYHPDYREDTRQWAPGVYGEYSRY